MRSIALLNPQPGVGKTTLAAHLAHACTATGRRVVLLDLDPAGALAPTLGLFRTPARGLAQLLSSDADAGGLSTAVIQTRELLCFVPNGDGLAAVLDGLTAPALTARLRALLAPEQLDAELVLIDTGTLSPAALAAVVATVDEVVLPVPPRVAALAGLIRFLLELRPLEAARDTALRHRVVLTRQHLSRDALRAVRDKARQAFGERLLDSVIDQSERVANAGGAGRTVFEFAPQDPVAHQLTGLFAELERHWQL